VRVVPNLYPAFEHQEVVIHSPRHAVSFAQLSEHETALVAEAWRLRAGAARMQGFGYVHALINEGRAAGASLSHTHSQVVWLREEPPAVIAERGQGCGVCSLVFRAENVIFERDGLIALCPAAGRAPYELLLAPTGHGDGPFDIWLDGALALLAEMLGAWNAWLHADGHPHIEVVPRIGVFAGVELGAGIWVNIVPPEDAAARLREAV
jgi:UDPglucose--hexose-1-phosphate uridylyltransferase